MSESDKTFSFMHVAIFDFTLVTVTMGNGKEYGLDSHCTFIQTVSGVHRPPEGVTIPPQLGVSRFYHDFLSCWFFYFASCLSSTTKLIYLL